MAGKVKLQFQLKFHWIDCTPEEAIPCNVCNDMMYTNCHSLILSMGNMQLNDQKPFMLCNSCFECIKNKEKE